MNDTDIQEIPTQPYKPVRWWIWATVLSALPAMFLADTGIAWLRGWARFGLFPDDLFFIRVLSACAIAPFAMAALPAGRRLLAMAGPAVSSIAISVFLAFLAGEGFVRVFNPGAPLHRRPPGLKKVFLPDPNVMPGINGPDSYYTINSLGVRGEEPPDRGSAHRILCVGGSTTECLYLDDAETWPAILRKMLNEKSASRKYWVGDVGFSGYTTEHHRELLEDADFVKQFDTLVFLSGINDLGRTLQGAPPISYEIIPVWKNSLLMRRIRDRIWPKGPAMRLTGAFHEQLRETRKKGRLTEIAPDLSNGLARYSGKLASIARKCVELGVGCVFLTQPVLWKKGMDQKSLDLCWGGEVSGGGFLTVEGQLAGIERFNETMISTAKSCAVPCIDLSPMNGNETYFCDDCHYTEAGAREVARIVAEKWQE